MRVATLRGVTDEQLALLRGIGNDWVRVRDGNLWRGDRINKDEVNAVLDDFEVLRSEGLVVIDTRRCAAVLTQAGYLALLSRWPCGERGGPAGRPGHFSRAPWAGRRALSRSHGPPVS